MISTLSPIYQKTSGICSLEEQSLHQLILRKYYYVSYYVRISQKKTVLENLQNHGAIYAASPLRPCKRIFCLPQNNKLFATEKSLDLFVETSLLNSSL